MGLAVRVDSSGPRHVYSTASRAGLTGSWSRSAGACLSANRALSCFLLFPSSTSRRRLACASHKCRSDPCQTCPITKARRSSCGEVGSSGNKLVSSEEQKRKQSHVPAKSIQFAYLHVSKARAIDRRSHDTPTRRSCSCLHSTSCQKAIFEFPDRSAHKRLVI